MRGTGYDVKNEEAITGKVKHCQKPCNNCADNGKCKSQNYAFGHKATKGKFYL